MPSFNAPMTPGVYDKEVDLSALSAPKTGTQAAAIFQGPQGLCNAPVFCTSIADFRKKFGLKDYKKYGFGMHNIEMHLAAAPAWVIRACDTDTARTALAYLTLDDPTATFPTYKLENEDNGTHIPQGVLGDPSTFSFSSTDPTATSTPLLFYAIGPGDVNHAVRIRPAAPAGTDPTKYANNFRFYVDVFPNFNGADVTPEETFLCSRRHEIAPDGTQLFVETRLANSLYVRAKNNDLCPEILFTNTAMEILDGGSAGNIVDDADMAPLWDKFADVNAYAGLRTFFSAGITESTFRTKMLTVAATRGDCTVIEDGISSASLSALVNDRLYGATVTDEVASYGAYYAPRAVMFDDVVRKNLSMPISGYISYIFSMVDAGGTNFVAADRAPAGYKRGNLPALVKLDAYFDPDDLEYLDQNQVNVIRKLDGIHRLFSQHTMQRAKTGRSNLHVRRLFCEIKATLRAVTIPNLYNPNDIKRQG